MDELKKCYELFGLSTDASRKEIKQTYSDLVQIHHPDRFAHNRPLQKKAEEKLKAINSCYEKIIEALDQQTLATLPADYQSSEAPQHSSGASTTSPSNPVPTAGSAPVELQGKQSVAQNVRYWVTKNRLYLFFAMLALFVAAPQVFAYLRYKDFPIFSDPKLLVTRLPSSLYSTFRNKMGQLLKK
ncbi:MAG: DnaJ domain-containing protein [Leptolyngbyaceae cyanobacterium bins.302]|nr:DnaJ domain-containing protein [Leptolyngbyaceae cyanobacterium bins.302]